MVHTTLKGSGADCSNECNFDNEKSEGQTTLKWIKGLSSYQRERESKSEKGIE